MNDRILYAYVSTRNRIAMLPETIRSILTEERGDIGTYIAAGLMAALAVVVGGTILSFVPGTVHNYVNNLLTNCLQGATSGTTPAGCP